MKFSKTHEWIDISNNMATIGITNYGKMHIGEIVNIKLPEKGKEVTSMQEVGVVESNKAAVDFHSPLTGKIIEVNEKLLSNLDVINSSPEKEGWLFKLQLSNAKEIDNLLLLQEYERLVAQ